LYLRPDTSITFREIDECNYKVYHIRVCIHMHARRVPTNVRFKQEHGHWKWISTIYTLCDVAREMHYKLIYMGLREGKCTGPSTWAPRGGMLEIARNEPRSGACTAIYPNKAVGAASTYTHSSYNHNSAK